VTDAEHTTFGSNEEEQLLRYEVLLVDKHSTLSYSFVHENWKSKNAQLHKLIEYYCKTNLNKSKKLHK